MSSSHRPHPVRFLTIFLTTCLYIVSLSTLGPAGASNLVPDSASPQSEPAQGESTKSTAQKSKAQSGTKHSASKQKNAKTSGPDLTGTWYYEINKNEHRGYIKLQQSGTVFNGIWHTTSKQEEDTPVVGKIYDGKRVVMRRSKVWGSHDQDFDLSLANNGIQLYGYGEGFFLNHTDMNMRRVPEPR